MDGGDWARLALLWLTGVSLRVTVLALPPVLPAIHHELRLDEKSVALLTALPVLVLAVAAVGGSLLVARLGARRALVAGLLTIGLGAALRGLGPSAQILLGATFVMGVGIAVSQPACPSLVDRWFPGRIALATGVYVNGLVFGEMIPTWLTTSVVMPLIAGSWELDLAAWALPALLGATLLAIATRQRQRTTAGSAGEAWWPDWRDGHTWVLGVILGCDSLAYWECNALIPDYLTRTGHAQLVGITLALFNTAQLLASLLVIALPQLSGRRAAFAGCGALCLGGLAGFYLAPGVWMVVAMAVAGLGIGLLLILVVALPPLLTSAGDVARMSAGIFTICYALSFTGPLIAGALWDLTGRPVAAFLPALVAGLVIVLLASRVPTPDRRGGRTLPLSSDLSGS